MSFGLMSMFAFVKVSLPLGPKSLSLFIIF